MQCTCLSNSASYRGLFVYKEVCVSVRKSPPSQDPSPIESQSQPNLRINSRKTQTASHPGMAGKPFVPQPGLEPDLISFRPERPSAYKKGLRKPSGFLPSEIKKSLSNAIMPAAVCILVVSRMFADGQRTVVRRVRGVRRTGVAALVPLTIRGNWRKTIW